MKINPSKINPWAGYFCAVLLMIAAAMSINGCATRDVFPVAQIKSKSPGLAHDGQSLQISIILNGPTNREISIPLVFTGSAVNGVHYNSSSSVITIGEGQDSGQISLSSIPAAFVDSLVIRVDLLPVEGILIGSPSGLSIPIVNANLDSDNDGIPNIDDECPEQAGPAANGGCPWPGLIVNEILYDPPADVAGDANQDGTRDPLADEFVEIFNDGPALDISGYTLSDASGVRHTFVAGTTLEQNGVIVVFGGGSPPAGAFGNAQVTIASSGQLNLNNSGDLCILKDLAGAELFRFDVSQFSGDPNMSYTRNPDLRGSFVLHSAVPEANGALFSPGKKLNGAPLTP